MHSFNISLLQSEFYYTFLNQVYRLESTDDNNENSSMSAYVSFGGLLMRLQGDRNHLAKLNMGQKVYVLIKKIAY